MLPEVDRYYIAVDGGGSKTEFCLYNLSTMTKKHFFSGSTNFKNPESDTKINLIDDGLNQIFQLMKIEPAQIKGLVMGLSGCDSQEDHDYFMGLAALSGIAREKIFIGNDCELAFFSKGKPPGLSVVAGTGSIATGISANCKKARSGGWGSVVSDEGSGAWIGISVVKDLLRYYDGYGEHRRIFDIIHEHMKERSFDTLQSQLSKCVVKELAGFAKLVMDEAAKDDAYCLELVHTAACLVAEISHSVYQKLNFSNENSIDIVMTGSLFKSKIFCEAFKENLRDRTNQSNICYYINNMSPIKGGITLAQSLFN